MDPSGFTVSTLADSADRAVPISDGWAAMQACDAPKMAALRFRPPSAEQPAPGERLLQGLEVS